MTTGKPGSNPPQKLICETCKEPFYRKVTKSYLPLFCSRKCSNESRVLVDIPCPICETMFKPNVIDIGRVRKQYCSAKCAWIAQSGKPSPKRTPKHIRDLVTQEYPQKGPDELSEILNMPKDTIQRIAYSEGVKLDKKVRQKTYKNVIKRMTGPNNPNWQGGTTYKEYGDSWPEQRIKTLKRDNYTCQVCFEFGNTVHHIKPRRFFENVDDSNDLSNLITLCDKHHVPVEIGKIPCPIPKQQAEILETCPLLQAWS